MDAAISLDVLVRAVAALGAAMTTPDDKPMAYATWRKVMESHAELSVRVTAIAARQEVAISA